MKLTTDTSRERASKQRLGEIVAFRSKPCKDHDFWSRVSVLDRVTYLSYSYLYNRLKHKVESTP